MNITICGGGNLGHVCAGFFAAQSETRVSLLTRQPELWAKHINVVDCNGRILSGTLEKVSNMPDEVIPCADIVLLCLPGYAIGQELESIAPYLKPSCIVGTVVSNTGFFFKAFEILAKSQPLFGFQRVPFISRITQYGEAAELKGYKESLNVAIEQSDDKEWIRSILEKLFQTPIHLLTTHYEASLSNSNPLLHTSRLYTMWHNWTQGVAYDRNPGFYSEWTIEASEVYIAMDNEFQQLLKCLGLRNGCIPPVLEYYESTDAESLTRKIRTIPAFQGILSPMLFNTEGMYEPDFNSRYFTEDFSIGLCMTHNLAHERQIHVPHIDKVYSWGIDVMQKATANNLLLY